MIIIGKENVMGGPLSEKEAARLGSILLAITGAIGSDGFLDTVLHEYSSLFNLDYCHLADMTEELTINIHQSLGNGDDVFRPYSEHGEHCVFKNPDLVFPPAPMAVQFDNASFKAIAQVNPLYEAIHKNIPAITTIAGVHPDRNGIIGLRYDHRELTDQERIISSLLAPQILALYHLHQKMIRYRDLNSYLVDMITGRGERPFIIIDSRWGIILNHNGFFDRLRSFGVSQKDIINSLNEHSLEKIRTVCGQHDSFNVPLGTHPAHLTVEPAYVDARVYYKIQVVEHTAPSAGTKVTRREREIFSMVKKGCTNRMIAEELSIAEETVKRHLSNLYMKTGAQNRTALSQMDL